MSLRSIAQGLMPLVLAPTLWAVTPTGGHLDWVFYPELPSTTRQAISAQCPGGFVDPWTDPNLSADELAVQADRQSGNLNGALRLREGVEITQAVIRLYGPAANYDASTRRLELPQGGLIRQQDLAILASQAEASTEQPEFRLLDTEYVLHSTQMHGQAAQIDRDDQLYRLERTWITRCAPGRLGWSLHAREMTINNETDIASGYHAWLNIGPVPVAYTPYFRFNLNQQRTSGLLTPSYRYVPAYQQHRLSTPYYWAIAPNADHTTTVDWLIGGETAEGAPQTLHIGQEWRYLHRNFYAEATGGYYPGWQDDRADPAAWGYRLQAQSYDSGLEWTLDVTDANSADYFPEFQYADYVSSVTNRATLGYSTANNIRLDAMVEQQNIFDEAAAVGDLVYVQQPGVHIRHPIANWRQWSVTGLYDWERRVKTQPDYLADQGLINPTEFNPYEGVRLRQRGQVSRSDTWRQWTLQQTYTGDHTLYQLPAFDDHPAHGEQRWLYDTRLRLSYAWDLSAGQRLTPFAMHEFRPLVDQTLLPQMSDADLLVDLNHLTVGSDYRINVGDWTHSANVQQRIDLTNTRLEKLGASVVINDPLDAGPQPGPVTVSVGTQYQTRHRFSASTTWTPEAAPERALYDREYPLTLLTTAYRYRADRRGADVSTTWRLGELETDQNYYTVVASATLPITRVFGVVGYGQWIQETVDDPLVLSDTLIGLEYDGCCWHLQLAGQRTVKDEAEQSQRSSLFDTIQLNLTFKGLGSLNTGMLQEVIEEKIPSYGSPLYNTK
ncbi:LPS-assembly protein LptD [Salinispirillum marinum]|uniref:LPS-assembly protein LptD n=1 Tax=Saccharospirillum mangrovi TaxID=2161747 RepID=A0ABV7ZWC5_9GAMM